jgi:hypothetical protein
MFPNTFCTRTNIKKKANKPDVTGLKISESILSITVAFKTDRRVSNKKKLYTKTTKKTRTIINPERRINFFGVLIVISRNMRQPNKNSHK